MPITLKTVTSSQINAIGYDAATKTLAIQFKNASGPGSTYHYAGVPAEVHAEMAAAESAGKFFGSKIKGIYPFEKQEPQKEAPPAADGAAIDLNSDKPLDGGAACTDETCDACQ